MKQYLDLMRHIRDHGNKKMDRTGTGTTSVFGWQSRYNLQDGFPLLTTKKLHLKSIIHELVWILSGSTNIKYLNDNGVKIWDDWADANGDLGPVYGHQWRAWPGSIRVQNQYADLMVQGDKVVAYTRNDNVVVQGTIDQISDVISRIKSHPDDRRLIVSAWNPADVEFMALPPCHCFFQFYTRELSLRDRESRCDLSRASGYEYVGDVDKHGHLDAKGIPRRYLDCQLYQRSTERLH